MGAVYNEMITGLSTGGKTHLTKARNTVGRINNLFQDARKGKEVLTKSEIQTLRLIRN